jgi:hypothetical protein
MNGSLGEKGPRNMHYYCHLASGGGHIERTNLQLYSFQEAARCWNELVDEILAYSTIDNVPEYRERLAFILSCFGLSLSQLLGQNNPSPEKERMDQPEQLLSTLLNRTSADQTTKRHLNSMFKDFLSYYGAVRHFGANKGEENYRKLDRLTVELVDRFRRMTIQIWDLIIAMYRKNKQNEIEEFQSIAEVVQFNELGKNLAPSESYEP